MTTTAETLRGLQAEGPVPTDAVIHCAGLTKVFRDFWLRNRVRAVDHIDLHVRRGEVFGLLGPNGSGKSTTIKMILGLLHPTSGRISVFGKRPEDVATKKLIGYLPEESYLYRFLNARETLDYYGRLFHQSGEQRRRRIDMLLEMVGLDAAQRRPVGEYSKGMQRRIGLAQALINDPQLLILDEPTTGMDPIGTAQIKQLILRLKEAGKTILLCSHLLADVEDVCDRVAIMFGGKVRREGTVEGLLVREGFTTLETDALDVDTIQQIESVLEARGKHLERVVRPRQKLETLFLDIVTRAHAEGVATTGARAGGRIADFLVTGAPGSPGSPGTTPAGGGEPPTTEALLDELMAGGAKPAADVPNSRTPPLAPARDAAADVVAGLEAWKPTPAAGSGAAPAAEADHAHDQAVLDELLDRTPTPPPAAAPPTPRREADGRGG